MKQKSLGEYCKNVIEHFKSDNMASSFEYAFSKELEELKVQQLKSLSCLKGYRNAIAVILNEHDRYYQEFNTSATTSAFNGFYTTQENNSTAENTVTIQEIANSNDPSTASSFETEVFKTGYKYANVCYNCKVSS